MARSEGNLEEAEQHFSQSQTILMEAERHPEACIAAVKLSDIYRDSHRWTEASTLIEQAEADARRLGAPAALARCLTAKGRLEAERPDSNLDQAEQTLKEAMSLAQQEGDTET